MDPTDSSGPGEVTRLLQAAQAGDPEASDRVFSLVYADLRSVAARAIRRSPGATLEATELVHEAYLKFARKGALAASDRAHFLAIAARAMRQVLVDRARRRLAAKRSGARGPGVPPDAFATVAATPEELVALDRALAGLEPRQRSVVECRVFAGMADPEIAEALGVSERTVRRDWVNARAWIHRALVG